MIFGVDDLPVWGIYKNGEGKYVPKLVAWYTEPVLNENRFLTLKTFGTKREAKAWLSEFWRSYWRLAL